MSAFVLDTNVASLILRKSSEAIPYIQHAIGAKLVLSFQTLAELRFGAALNGWGASRMDNLEAFIADQTIVQSSDALIGKWTTVMRDARISGRRLEAGDAWIAATALLLNIPLLTHDKDFDTAACPSITVIRYS